MRNHMFVCSTSTVGLKRPIQATPTITIEKKNDGRIISIGRRIISDMRRVNLGFGKMQSYIANVPTMTDVARTIIASVRKNPGIQIAMAKSDMAPAFRFLRPHPTSAQLMVPELPGRHIGLCFDAVLFYLVMPFCWNGSHANFASFGDAVSLAHQPNGLIRQGWAGCFLPNLCYMSLMAYSRSGPFRAGRMRPPMSGGGLQTEFRTIKRTTRNKMEEDGRWSTVHFILGFVVNAKHLNARLHGPKIAGARALANTASHQPDTQNARGKHGPEDSWGFRTLQVG